MVALISSVNQRDGPNETLVVATRRLQELLRLDKKESGSINRRS